MKRHEIESNENDETCTEITAVASKRVQVPSNFINMGERSNFLIDAQTIPRRRNKQSEPIEFYKQNNQSESQTNSEEDVV